MWHNYINYYLNCLRDVDRHIGTILNALEASGQADDTIIVFTADHGDMLGAHGMRQKGIVPFKRRVECAVRRGPSRLLGRAGHERSGFDRRYGADAARSWLASRIVSVGCCTRS